MEQPIKNSLLLAAAALGLAGCQPLRLSAPTPSAAAGTSTFVNAVYEGADPFVFKHTDRHYYFVQSEGDVGIAVWKSDKLTDKGVKRVVWMAPKEGWNTSEVWAPEIHHLDGKWYIYYAADSGENKDHRMGVLESVTDDPQGRYIDRGMLYTGDDVETGTNNRWAIDGTPLRMNGKLFFLWSGWEAEADEQWLYIAEMENPWTIKSNRVRIADNDDHLWERVAESPKERGLNEGPQILRRNGWVHVVYSVSGSWQPTYKLAMLSIREGADPLVPVNWREHPQPVFQGNANVHGVGHASFTTSPDDKEEWIVYHSKIDTTPGWRRNVRMQPFRWTADGIPAFGEAVPEGVPVPLPSGERATRLCEHFSDSFADSNWDSWIFYGYNRFISTQNRALSIDPFAGPGMANHYTSGEKALVRGCHWTDVELSARVTVVQGDREAGLLFRAHHPAVGVNAIKGYFAGIDPTGDRVVLGRMDGSEWTQIATAAHPLEHGKSYRITARAVGDRIEVSVDGERRIATRDAAYRVGMVGVRSVDVHALYDDVQITGAQQAAKGQRVIQRTPATR